MELVPCAAVLLLIGQAATPPIDPELSAEPPASAALASAQTEDSSAGPRYAEPAPAEVTPAEVAPTDETPAVDSRSALEATPRYADPELTRPESSSPAAAAQPDRLVPVDRSFAEPKRLAGDSHHSAASLDQEAAESADRSESSVADSLVRQALEPPLGANLSGQPLTLYALILEDSADRPALGQRVSTYWELSSALARYHEAIRYRQRLEALESRVPAESSAATAEDWVSLRARGDVFVESAHLQALTAQYRLAQLRQRPEATLPLPADPPHTGAYRTLFEQLYPAQSGQPLSDARRLHETLPLMHRLILARARAAQAARSAGDRAAESTSADVSELGHAMERHFQILEEFFRDVQVYNQSIASYAVLSAPAGIDAARLVGMLIKPSSAGGGLSPVAASPGGRAAGAMGSDGLTSVLKRRDAALSTPTGPASPVVPATAEEGIGPPGPTPAEGPRDPFVRRAEPEQP